MDEYHKSMIQNAIILKIAPEFIEFSALFADLGSAMEQAFGEFASVLTGEKPDMQFGDDIAELMEDVTAQVYAQVPSIVEAHSDVIMNIEKDGLLDKAQQLADEIAKAVPDLVPLQYALADDTLLKYVAILKTESDVAKDLNAFIDCMKPLFDVLDEEQQQAVRLEGLIFSAAETGNLEELNEVVDAGIDLNAENNDRMTGLMLAVKSGHTDFVTTLLESGADPLHMTFFDDSALSIAVKNNNSEMLELLLDHAKERKSEIDWEKIASRGLCNDSIATVKYIIPELEEVPSSLLRDAIDDDSFVLMQSMLDAGLDVDSKIYSDTLLIYALENNRLAMAELLIKAGADKDVENFFGQSPLFKAINDNETEKVELLQKHGAKVAHERTDDLFRLILDYAEQNNITNLEAITRLNIDDLQDNNSQELFLRFAVGHEDANLIQYLVSHGTDVNVLIRDRNELSSIENTEILQLLIDSGLDINHRFDDGEPFIIDYIKGKNEPVLQCLVSNNVILDVDDVNGEHLLFTAMSYYHSFVNNILQYGVDPDIKNKKGYTSVQADIHRYWDFSDVIVDFAKAGADFSVITSQKQYAEHVLAACYDANTIKQVCEHTKVDINKAGTHGHTPLSAATYANNSGAIKLLVDMGADVNTKSHTMVTPLALAISRNNLQLVKLLIEECHADTTDKFIDCYSPLELARKLEHQQIVDYLS